MKTVIFVALFPLIFVSSSFCQIDQDHPELCGKPGGTVPLPPNIAAAIDRSIGQGDLFLGSGNSATKISLPGVVNKIAEVCPLSDGRLVVFAESGYSTNIDIVDRAGALLKDDIWAFTPAMSPDQRWLAYRKFYPRHTELPVSEEYLLYDLTKSAGQNRRFDVTLDDHDDAGTPVYPWGRRISAVTTSECPETSSTRPARIPSFGHPTVGRSSLRIA